MNVPTDHYDMIEIDSGPAGEQGAAHAAQDGKRGAGSERWANGGGTGVKGTGGAKRGREGRCKVS